MDSDNPSLVNLMFFQAAVVTEKYTALLNFCLGFYEEDRASECLSMLSFYLSGVAFRCGWKLICKKL